MGLLYREGRLYTQEEVQVFDHDWPSLAQGIAIPHGLYDLSLNIGYVQIGTSHDTGEVAYDSIRYWWEHYGCIEYPKAILAMVKASLRAVHGAGNIKAGISNYYLVEEIQAHFAGMMIALPNQDWACFYPLSVYEFSLYLKHWAALVDLKRFASSPRAKKKDKPKLEPQLQRSHVSTARLLSRKLSKAP
jgi:Rhodopirellula transposase DDE domain